MGFDDGFIIFDRPGTTYNTGDTVSGKLVFHQDKPKKFRGIYVEFKGYCNVHWTTTHTRDVSGPNNTRTTETYNKNHSSHEEYFRTKMYLIGSDRGEYHLQPGNHEFPFAMLIPQHCPSSYEGGYGNIRYILKFVVDRYMRFNQEKAVNLHVVAVRDLNVDPYCKKPINFQLRKSYCCWCMSSGDCDVTVRLPASGYCPGQAIPIEVSVDNKSNVKIEYIKLELKEETTFIAEYEPGTQKKHSVLANIEKGPIEGNTSRNWDVEMDIPLIDVRNVDACKYIDVNYEFEVTISPKGCHRNTGESALMILGHIPLREFEDGPPQNRQVTQQYNTSYPGVNPPYPDAQPPYKTVQPGYPGPNPPHADMGFQRLNPFYPGGNPPYPGANPFYPGENQPYPSTNSPYPPPYSAPNNEKTGMILLPTAGPPYPPAPSFTMASAPEPSTPDLDGTNKTPAYNPWVPRN